MDLTPRQLQSLASIQEAGFSFVAFPMYANYVGVRRAECACLLTPTGDSAFRIYGEPSWLLSGNLTVLVTRHGRPYFVWKNRSLEASTERMAELRAFAESLEALLHPPTT